MLEWVRESRIEVYCECIKDKGNDNINEDNAVSNDNNKPVSQYDDIDDDGVLTPSSIYEDQFFNKERKRKTMTYVYDPRVDHVTFKFKVMLRFKDVAEFKGDVRKRIIIHKYNFHWIKSISKQLDARCQEGCN